MEDPAEEINVFAPDRLPGEEVVPRELDARFVLFGQHFAALLRRAGQILHNEVHVFRRVGQMLRHAAVPSPHIHQYRVRRVERRPVVVGGQVLDVEGLAFGHELHALPEPSRALGLVRQESVQGEIGVVAEAVRRFVRFARIWEPGHGFGHLHEGGPHFAGPHAHVVEEFGVLDHHAADGGVSDAAGRGFGEDAIRH